jgi:hypothetical protein
MTKKEIKQKEIEQAKYFRNLGFNFRSLVQHYLQEQNFQTMLKERLVFIKKMDGKVCICSAFSIENDGSDGTNVVPALWCITHDNKDKTCPYVKPAKEELEKAVALREDLKKYQKD